jgi:predicted nucleic acid-binding protein
VTLAEAVVDASAVVRGLTTEGQAAALLDRVAEGAAVGHAPDLIAEVSSALALAVRTERRLLGDAQSLFELLASSPIELHPTTPLAAAAIELAATRRCRRTTPSTPYWPRRSACRS